MRRGFKGPEASAVGFAQRENSPLGPQFQELREDILEHVQRLFPELPSNVPLKFRPIAVWGTHEMGVVEAGNSPVRRLFMKGPRKDGRKWMGLEVEHRILTEVAPKISAQNPLTRCPSVVAYYPDREILLLEMVEGAPLHRLLFGWNCPRDSQSLGEYLRLSGEWLARFHGLTRSERVGNPFEWLVNEFESIPTRSAFEQYAGLRTYRAVRDLADRFRREQRSLKKSLCGIHGAFTPGHVFVQDERIYVIDLESSRMGYAYEDLAYFTARYDMFYPWRRDAEGKRIDLDGQRDLFLKGYVAHASPLGAVEGLIIHLARFLSMLRIVRRKGPPKQPVTKSRGPKFWWRRFWLRYRFGVLCRQELRALQDATKDF